MSALPLGSFDSRAAFSALVLLVAAERAVELVLAARNLAWARARGGGLIAEPLVWPAMVGVHALWLALPPLEVYRLGRPFVPALGWPALGLALGAMALRYWAVATLGRRWSPRVVVVPGLPAETGGPYRFVRHPNYLAVFVELAALPLVHTAWLSALVLSVANAPLVVARIRVEEAALAATSSYRVRLGDRPRFVPWRRR